MLTRDPGLRPAQFDPYLADFLRLEVAEAAGSVSSIAESEILDVLTQVGLDKSTPELDGLSSEM